MKKMFIAGAAIAALLASNAQAASLVISTGTASLQQNAAASTQAASAVAAVGEVRNNSEVKNAAVNLKNSIDFEQSVTSGGAEGAQSGGSFGGFLTGSEYDIGDVASSASGSASSVSSDTAANAASGASSTDNLLGPDSASNYASAADASSYDAAATAFQAASSGAWNTGSEFAGAFGGEFYTTGFSADVNIASLGMSQYADVATQTATAQLNTGAVLDYSTVSNTAANIINTMSGSQAVGNCNCVPSVSVVN
ncbi:MAG TPA: hypothetical protein VHO23_02065 [Candidatus Paceibacterota bacterium]|nr:hypothetical protein [Candidatus Paceibacterota bacterium]